MNKKIDMLISFTRTIGGGINWYMTWNAGEFDRLLLALDASNELIVKTLNIKQTSENSLLVVLSDENSIVSLVPDEKTRFTFDELETEFDDDDDDADDADDATSGWGNANSSSDFGQKGKWN